MTDRLSSLIPLSSRIYFLAALTLGFLAAACGSEPQQTMQYFEARPTPTPQTLAPTPTVFGGPYPTPPPISPADWHLDASSTGDDLLALLSEGERSCIEDALGDRFSTFRTEAFMQESGPLGEPGAGGCLTPESTAGFAIAMFSATAGGLSADTRSCLADVFTRNPQAAPSLASDGDAGQTADFEVIACLTPDEAAAMTPPDAGPPPDAASLRCLTEELMKVDGGQEVLRIFSTADPAGLTVEQSALLGQAVSACGVETDFTFPDAGDASPKDDAASTDDTGTPSQ